MLNPHGYSRARLLLMQTRELLEGKQGDQHQQQPAAMAALTDAEGILCADGARRWIAEGVLHRSEGAAIEYPNGLGERWQQGVFQGYLIPVWKPHLAAEVFVQTIESIEKWALARPADELQLHRTKLTSSYAALLDALAYAARLGKQLDLSHQEAADLYKHADALLMLSDCT